MARKDADFILSDLDAGEVSLVPKAANKRKFLLLKMDASAEPQEISMEDLNEQFEAEILKAELEEVLATPLDGEEDVLKEALEKAGTLSPRALQALRGIVRLTRGLEGELPGQLMDMLRGLMGATPEAAAAGKQAAGKGPGRDKALSRYTKTSGKVPGRDKELSRYTKSDEEDKGMAEEVTKDAVTEEDPQATATESETQEVSKSDSDDDAQAVEKAGKAKKQEDDEEEEDDKKKPPFLKTKGKDKMEKSDDLSVDSLPAEVQALFKAHTDQLNAEREAVRKEREELRAELAAEKDARATEQAIQKAAVDYPNLPIKAEELGPMVKLAKANFSETQYGAFERILKAADNAIAETKAFEETKGNTFELTSGEQSALGKLNEIAKGIVEKSESGLSEAAAFARAADENPQLYDQYLAEMRG